MKKLTLTILTIFAVFLLTACGAGGFTQPSLPEAPWGTPALVREIKTFNVNIYCAQTPPDEDRNNLVLANGTLIQTLEGCDGRSPGSRCRRYDLGEHLHVHTHFTLTWGTHENAGLNAGLTDVIETRVSFTRNGLVPIASERAATLAPRYEDGVFAFNNSHIARSNFELSARDVGTETSTNLSARQSTLQLAKNADGVLNPVQNQSITTGTVYCNEQLHYLIRGLSNVRPGGAISLPVNNVIENSLRGSSVPLPVTVNVPADLGLAVFDDFEFLRPFIVDADEVLTTRRNQTTEEYEYIIPAMGVIVGLGETPAGPPHQFILTAPHIQLANGEIYVSRLILRYFYDVFNIYGTRIYHIAYTLIDYSVE